MYPQRQDKWEGAKPLRESIIVGSLKNHLRKLFEHSVFFKFF